MRNTDSGGTDAGDQPGRPRPGAGSKGQHAVDATLGLHTELRVDQDLTRAVFERVEHPLQAIHGHPRAMRAAFAGCTIAGGRCFDEAFAGCGQTHLVQQAVVGGDDEGIGRQLARSVDNLGG